MNWSTNLKGNGRSGQAPVKKWNWNTAVRRGNRGGETTVGRNRNIRNIKELANAFGCMDVSSFSSGQQHVSATHVTIFRLVRAWVAETWWWRLCNKVTYIKPSAFVDILIYLMHLINILSMGSIKLGINTLALNRSKRRDKKISRCETTGLNNV